MYIYCYYYYFRLYAIMPVVVVVVVLSGPSAHSEKILLNPHTRPSFIIMVTGQNIYDLVGKVSKKKIGTYALFFKNKIINK